MSALIQASSAQIDAAHPERSTWVSANAGSGKTRVLTNRVARLLLAGCEPQKILCLTFTKAAAAEMQNRLFSSLGAWAMKPDDDLRKELAELGETALDAENLRLARTLFARALEAPGGLKIQTIHSFCSGILRRFPLEAGVSPQFQEMEDRQSKQLWAEILEEIATDDGAVFDAMAWHLSGDETGNFLDGILKNRPAFAQKFDGEKLAKAMGTISNLTDEAILAGVMQGVSDTDIDQLAQAMANGGKNDKKFSDQIVVDKKISARAVLELYESLFLTKDGIARSQRGFPSGKVTKAAPWVSDVMASLKDRMVVARDHRLGQISLSRAKALHDFGKLFLDLYEARKAALGRLDFEDLIQKTRNLLTRTNMAAWILYRLDGGIDHILVDEAQDTSPNQWDIVRILAEEFHAGTEDRATPRTIFVVGDEKQSIYSFQGADPSKFGAMRTVFSDRLSQVAQDLQKTELLYSFRSSAPVLALVDRVFTGEARDGLEGDIQHRAVYADKPGKIELWPFAFKSDEADENPWYVPVDSASPDDPKLRLAGAIAVKVGELIKSKHILPGKGRAVSAGDFLVLVQTRGKLFHAIIKALKANGVDVAGADRLKIVEEVAVKDLLALMQFLATPEDDLSLAAVLRSPLFGLSEGDLYRLAHGRTGTMWQSLWHHRTEWPDVYETLNTLQREADFIRPYDLLERILTGFDGRRKLVARLGSEAEDGIDELLAQSLRYESVEAPLLTGFLSWITSDDVEVKRQMDNAGDRVRVMTVHGAKGLEAPIVILPDTTKRSAGRNPPAVVTLDGMPAWKTASANATQAMVAVELARTKLVREENMRLLYVALTRAENWLIVCGAGTLNEDGEAWYSRVEAAMQACGAVAMPTPIGLSGDALTIEHNWDAGKGNAVAADERTKIKLPKYLTELIETPPRPTLKIAPSELGGAHALPGDVGEDETTAMRRGTRIHQLLEVLPVLAAADRPARAAQILGDDWQEIYDEVAGVLIAPELREIFGPDTLTEVGVTSPLLDGQMFGRIDRLVVSVDSILAIDFKSNRSIPQTAEQTPEAFLRQMGAYGAALARIYPNHTIRTAIVWTRNAELMELPQKITQAALERASTP